MERRFLEVRFLEETNVGLQVKDSEGNAKVIEKLAASDSRRTLGVRLAPDGNNEAEVKFLRERAQNWADRVRTGHLPRRLVWESMNTTILKSLQYPLPATTLTEEECRWIMAPLLAQGLPASGVVRSIPRAVVYGPVKFQGLGIPNLYTFQQTQHILRILKYCLVEENITGQLIRHSLEATKLEIGCEGSVLMKSFDEVGCLTTSTWLTHTWKFLSENNMRIEDSVPELELQREGDQYLIRLFQQARFKGGQLQRLNLCRIFLKVVTVSDIATGCGMFISTSAWNGKVDGTRSERYDWPNQGEPSARDWDLWRSALQVSLCSRQRVLQRRLGRWFANASARWYYDERSEQLFEAENDRVLMYHRVPGRASRSAVRRFRNPSQVEELPQTAKKATVDDVRTTVVLTGWADTVQPLVPTHLSLHEFIESSVPKHARWAIERFQAEEDGLKVAEAIRRGRCIGVSDGSFKDRFGTACWTLKADDEETVGICCPCVVPGDADSHSAYRSELAGLYGMATMVWTLCKFFQIKEGAVELACDGLQALRHASTFNWTTDPRSPQFDLLTATRSMLSQCPVELHFRHVKGHQDDDFYAELDEWAKLNIEMDDGAKEHWYRFRDQRSQSQYVYGEPWPLWIAGTKLTKEVARNITEHIDGEAICEYWKEKGRFGSSRKEAIHWDAIGKAMEEVGRPRRQWIVKHASGFCATGKMMKRWKQQSSSKCPRCDEEVEDALHVWRCTGEGVEVQWKDSIQKLHLWMLRSRSQPNLAAVICDRLSAWRSKSSPTVNVSYFLGLRETVQAQDDLGWRSFLEGCPVKGWAEVQQRHFEFIKSKRTGERWLAAVIQKVWDAAWDLWDHRNKVVHGKESNSRLRQLRWEIEEQFDLGSATVTHDAKLLFRPGKEKILEGNADLQTAWLVRIRRARARFAERLEEEQSSFRSERRMMAGWLRRDGSR